MCAFESRGRANVVGIHNLPVPGTDEVVFITLAGSGGSNALLRDGKLGAMFNARNLSQWRAISSPESLFCAGHTVTADGQAS
jgi:hypothetical protein